MENLVKCCLVILSILSSIGILLSCTTAVKNVPKYGTENQIDERIRELRTKELSLSIRDSAGKLLANQEIIIEQQSHEFLFGCSLADYWNETSEVYNERFTALFNYATLPIYWKWYNEKRVERMAAWCGKKGLLAKAHPVIWHEAVPDSITKDEDEVEQAIKERVMTIVGHYKGVIDVFDVLNESLAAKKFNNPVGSWIVKKGPVEAAFELFSLAKEANPNGRFIINDYDTTKAYPDELNSLVQTGCPIYAIGIQSHMHQGVWPLEKVWDTCDKLSGMGCPVHFTEMSILSAQTRLSVNFNGVNANWDTTPEGEKTQAKEVAEIYRLLFSHPSVEAITWWSFTDKDAWLGAPSGLCRKDMSVKPAYEALYNLIRKVWWTGPLTLKTDKSGNVTFRGFKGSYKATVNGKELGFKLSGDSPTSAELKF
jgi:endo-1,4-beta-xylanase